MNHKHTLQFDPEASQPEPQNFSSGSEGNSIDELSQSQVKNSDHIRTPEKPPRSNKRKMSDRSPTKLGQRGKNPYRTLYGNPNKVTDLVLSGVSRKLNFGSELIGEDN